MASEVSKKLAKHKKTGRLYNKDTGLVFNSADKDRMVIGRIDNEEFVPLDQEAVDLCEKHGVKYDESLVEVEEAEPEDVPKKKPAKKSEKEKEDEEEDEEEDVPKKKPAKKSEKEEDDEEPAPVKKGAKKVSSEEEESEEPAKKAPTAPAKESQTKENKATPAPSGVAKGDFLARHAKELEDYIASVRHEGETARNRVQELEKEVENLKLEIAKRDKKIKAFLSE